MLHLTQEAHAFAKAVQQGEMRLRAHDSQRDPRQPRSRTDIDKARALQIRRDDDAVQDMTHQHLIWIANGGQVIGFVPLIEQPDVSHQLIFLVIGEQNTRFIQQTRKFVEHGKYLQK
ncbi:hypothetical protein SB00610_01854 [Klebsiella quasipneumoniae subsp. similipneumoniae]|nr:hypothetical protein SB00610_01854 [Klebsiella quasipneumoniae subsp. similipneumoniae]